MVSYGVFFFFVMLFGHQPYEIIETGDGKDLLYEVIRLSPGLLTPQLSFQCFSQLLSNDSTDGVSTISQGEQEDCCLRLPAGIKMCSSVS